MKKKAALIILIGLLTIISSQPIMACNPFSIINNKSVSSVITKVAETITPKETAEFEILPTMNTVSNAKNTVWVGTFQLIWNDLIDELIKNPVEFVGYSSTMAENLNKKEITVNDLDAKSYYKAWGKASLTMKQKIENGIKEKFNEKSDILDNFDWTPEEGEFILYAMLKKDFEYLEKFDKLSDGEFKGSNGPVKYFGIDGNSRYQLRETVSVLFYNNSNDFAVLLKSKQGDNVYLYRTNDNKTLDVLYSDMIKKSNEYTGNKYFASIDKLKIPVLEFKSEREFKELCNKPIKNTSIMIAKAIETVQFKMDETGVKLKSEAGMMTKRTSLGPNRDMPRYFYFTDKYTVFLQDNGKSKPYFAMRITDAKSLQK